MLGPTEGVSGIFPIIATIVLIIGLHIIYTLDLKKRLKNKEGNK